MSDQRSYFFDDVRLIDPASQRDSVGNLLVVDGLVQAIDVNIDLDGLPEGALVVSGSGLVLAPGLVDLAAHSGEPGSEHRETMETLSKAAAAGGVTTALLMPTTKPVVDSAALVDYSYQRARATSKIKLLPSAALTKGAEGKELTETGLLQEAGALAFTDGFRSIPDNGLMLRLMNYLATFDALMLHLGLDKSLNGDGVMNAGEFATRLGLPASPDVAERVGLERDLALAEVTGVRYHALALSSATSLPPLRRARQAGIDVTAGVTINHLSLNELEIGAYRTFFKVIPPLRTEDDRVAMVDAVRNGTIDVICSGHNPQDVEAKRLPFAEAAYGASGIETMLSAALRLYHDGSMTLLELLAPMTVKPADLLGIPQGRLSVGSPADLVLIDIDKPWKLTLDQLHSRSTNSPFEGATFCGKVLATWVDGALVFGAKNLDGLLE